MSNVFLSGFDGTITASTYAVISSEFNAANTASWLTTSYLITSTAFQPLYGRFSDIFGRRTSFFTATITFMIGCLGCGVAKNIILLNLMRALTGIGGGGLMTMGTLLHDISNISNIHRATRLTSLATIVNSDLIPFRRRGMYQALQNGMHGFGSICGAAFGGSIVDTIGWRWCFLMQVPVGFLALITGHLVIHLPKKADVIEQGSGFRAVWKVVDFSGALFLILGLSSQLIGLSLGGNELPWSNIWVILSLVGSVVLLGIFMTIEAKTTAIPLIPPRMLQGVLPIATQIANVCVGMAAYAVRHPYLQYIKSILMNAVPFHSAPPISSDPAGIRHEGWREIGHSLLGYTDRRAYLWHCHVPLGQVGVPGADWCRAHVHRQPDGDVHPVR